MFATNVISFRNDQRCHVYQASCYDIRTAQKTPPALNTKVDMEEVLTKALK